MLGLHTSFIVGRLVLFSVRIGIMGIVGSSALRTRYTPSPTMTKSPSPTEMPTSSATTGIVSLLVGLGGVGAVVWVMI